MKPFRNILAHWLGRLHNGDWKADETNRRHFRHRFQEPLCDMRYWKFNKDWTAYQQARERAMKPVQLP